MTEPLRVDPAQDIVLDELPDEVLATMQIRDRWMASLPCDNGALEFLVADLQSWTPGQTLRVAFLSGTPQLHQSIKDATDEIAAATNLTLDFGPADAFRTWTTSDTEYAAEIRVSFDQKGYFSLLGTDGANPAIGISGSPVGGRPHQRSLNLDGFDHNLPPTWRGTTRHEFLHALAFAHEHQNMRGPCELAFRWEDDPGYQSTAGPNGSFVADSQGRRPGIYTYLSGPPNSWPKAKVDHNLRTNPDSPAVAGPFDAASVMLYRFPALFYRTQPSPCAPSGDGQHLSDGDIRGLRLLYPQHADALAAIGARQETLIHIIESTSTPDAAFPAEPHSGLESLGIPVAAPNLPDAAAYAIHRLRAAAAHLHG